MAKRDDFRETVKRNLAMRVGFFCSNPECRRQTAGASSEEDKAVHFGKASHITAAAPGGPRFDVSLTSEQRRSYPNGIWLCSNCADIIDKDGPRYSVHLLNEWKKKAEAFSFRTYATSLNGFPITKFYFKQDEFDQDFLKKLGLQLDDSIENTISRIKPSAVNDIATFSSALKLSNSTIPLSLNLQGTHATQTIVTIEGLAKSILVADRISLVSPSGRGKTITLVQIAEQILHADQAIAVLIPLGEWSDYPDTFFECLVKRNSFRSFRPEHFMQLAYYGRLILILDGWNELNSSARIKAERQIKALKRDFPQLIILISRKHQMFPIDEIVLEIEPLSDEQQIKLAQKLCGEKGEEIVDRAWRIPSLRQLITIPLYFHALLTSVPTGALPQTKDEVLALFINQHEKSPEKVEIFQNELLGFQEIILADLAAEANRLAINALPNANARRTISETMKKLQDDQQITTALQPNHVLDVLVNMHLLTRSSTESGRIAFHHEQFQKWYASLKVEQLIIDSFNGNKQSNSTLKIDILNSLPWEDSVLFACERLSRKNEIGVKSVAAIILETLGIDPMLAAEMINRAAPNVWALISKKIIDFVNRWHKPNEIDRAIRFIIISGRPDFSQYIWPLISSPNQQLYLKTLRMAYPFRPSVLGSNAKALLAQLPETIRSHVIAEIGYRSEFDGIELATYLAEIDKNPNAVVEIIKSLYFRRAQRHVKSILNKASDDTWRLLASEDYPNNLLDHAQNAKLIQMRQSLISDETDPIKIINLLTVDDLPQAGADERIRLLIEAPEFPVTSSVGYTIDKAFKIYPHAVAAALLRRITLGLEIPYYSKEFLDTTPTIDDGPIAIAVMDSGKSRSFNSVAYSLVGPLTVGYLFDKFFIINDEFCSNKHKIDDSTRDEYHRLSAAILLSRQSSFITALLERSNTDQQRRVEVMSDLLARHGKEHEMNPLVLTEDIKNKLVQALKKWVKLALTPSNPNQHLLSNIARAITRVPNSSLVDDLNAMLKCELKIQAESRQDYKVLYHQAFSAIGDEQVFRLMKEYLSDLNFGYTAALVLRDIWNKKNFLEVNNRFTQLDDFSKVRELRLSLCTKGQQSESCEIADEIFKIIVRFSSENSIVSEQIHALKLATVALNLAHGARETELVKLYALPLKFAHKLQLLTMAALSGYVIPVDILNAGLKELLADGVINCWRLEDRNGEIFKWLQLYPFSDQPLAILAMIDLLPANYQDTWHIDRLLSAFGNSPHEQSVATLESLAKRDPKLIARYSWLDAFFVLDTEAAAEVVLNLICEGSILKNINGLSIWKLSRKLAKLIIKFPSMRDRLLKSYEVASDPKSKRLFEEVLIELSDPSVIISLINSFARSSQPDIYYKLSEAIRKVAIEERPSMDWDNAYDQFSVPLTNLRKELFDLLALNDARSPLAEACLVTIDNLRDEYGHPENEPRHPNIQTNLPWPKEAADIQALDF